MTRKYRGRIELLSPLSHHGDEKTGSTPVLRTITIFSPVEKTHLRIPCVSGNAIRGMLRRLVMHDLLERVGFTCTPRMHHVLFSGGILESVEDSEGELDLAFRNSVRQTIPPLALWGCAIGNQMIQGSLIVLHAVPAARETKYLATYGYGLADESLPNFQHSIRTFTDVDFFTRRDELRAEREVDEQAIQMKVEYEVLIPGTVLLHGFELRYTTKIEESCLGHVLDLWEQSPVLGGKSAQGNGRVRFEYEPRPSGDLYRKYLEERRDDILRVLEAIAERVK